MPGMHLFRSHRLELLARLLGALVVDKAPSDPIEPIEIVVGSRGMERWLRHELAQSLTVCANFKFPFPAARIDSLVASVLGAGPSCDPAPDPWAPESLTWALLEVLPSMVGSAGFEVVRGYLNDPAAWNVAVDAKQYGLARRLADVFDRYVAYRPDLARAWSANAPFPLPPEASGLAWQRTLWRAVHEQLGRRPHRAERLAAAERVLRSTKRLPTLTSPLFLFGISSLPPAWMSLLGALSVRVDVELFLLTPSNTYWTDLQRIRRDQGGSLPSDRDEVAEVLRDGGGEAAHPLLASMGRVARDFQLVLESQPDHTVDERTDAFPDPALGRTPSALTTLQSDLLAARHPSQVPRGAARKLDARDDSVQFHSCYGPTRQVEALRDVLLGMLADAEDLEPRDILVMTPDIETYAPLITAVFSEGTEHRREKDGKPISGPAGWGPSGAPRIPFEVADLSVRRLNPVADALLRLLELSGSRLEASAVIDLLTLEPVRTRFGLDATELAILQSWIGQCGIRWGRDAGHREREGQPGDPQNTWRFGLRRLLLGAVMADDGQGMSGRDALGHDTLVRPFDDIEGTDAPLAGKLADFCNTLFDVIDGLSGARTLEEWAIALDDVLLRMTATPGAASWLTRRVRESLSELARTARDVTSSRPVGLDAIRAALAGRFDVASRVTAEQSGAVTFCAMRPMRSVPYKVVCLLGMDDGAFPRKDAGVAFDWTRQRSQVGDMDPRDEDRYLVVEAILAARRKLVVVYTGRDPHTNAHTPPCVPVAELRDVVDVTFPAPFPSTAPSRRMTVEHPLQAFSPKAFIPSVRLGAVEPRPWSFDRRLLAAARARRHKVQELPAFLLAASPAANTEIREVGLDELLAFFKNPAKFLVRRRLGIHLEDAARAIPDREPIELDSLQRWQLRSSLLRERQRGHPASEVLRRMRADGTLPLGAAGKSAVDAEAGVVEKMLVAARLVSHAGETPIPPDAAIPIDVALAGARLSGSLTSVYRSVLVDLQFGADAGKRLLGAWLSLLAWHAMQPDTAGNAVVVLGDRDGGDASATLVGFEPPADCKGLLEALIALYGRGLAEPIPLLPASSWTFARALQASATSAASFDGRAPSAAEAAAVDDAYHRALAAWDGTSDGGDRADPYVARLFEGHCPLQDVPPRAGKLKLEFARLAMMLWGQAYRAPRKDIDGWLGGGRP